VARFGHLGVELFFLISGFVILMSAWGRTPGDFAVSRVTRLFPAYWFSCLFTVVIFYTTGTFFANADGPDSVLHRLLPNLTMLQDGFGAPRMEGLYWTLWVELHFYALVALLIWGGITYSRCVGFMISWLLVSTFVQESSFELLKTTLIVGWAPYFIAGMAFFLIYKYRPNLVLWLIVGACWALSCYYNLRYINQEDTWPGVHQYVQPTVITACYMVVALVATHRLSWLRWRLLTTLGALTYPLYLLHETVARPIVKYLYPGLGRWAVLGIAAGSAVTVSYLVYRFVETPVQRWMRGRLKSAVAEIRAGGLGRLAQRPEVPADGSASSAATGAVGDAAGTPPAAEPGAAPTASLTGS
jgi:peptidoglycan/LPS O-acetylase OafA/YrhL